MVGQHCSSVELTDWSDKDTPQIWKVLIAFQNISVLTKHFKMLSHSIIITNTCFVTIQTMAVEYHCFLIAKYRCSTTIFKSSVSWRQMSMNATGWCLCGKQGNFSLILNIHFFTLICINCISQCYLQDVRGAKSCGVYWQREALFLHIQRNAARPGVDVLLQQRLQQAARCDNTSIWRPNINKHLEISIPSS